ncbi:MAG: hypothetical protein H7A40_03615 [Chlamydiales bacterium]|nr:hypothetical protein [Chlamydiales bacterium]
MISEKDLGLLLKKQLDKDPHSIAEWAYELYFSESEFTFGADNVLENLMLMDSDPQMELTVEQLSDLAERLLKGEKDAINKI